MILVSIDTHTGRAVSFSLPRNLMNVPFPEDSPLHDVFPNGFTGAGDAGNWMLNAVYREVPILYPHILGAVDQRGRGRDQAGLRGRDRSAGRLLRPDRLPGLPAAGERDRRRHGQHQRAGRGQRRHRRRHPADPLPAARARPAPRRLRRTVVLARAVRRRRLPADGPAALHDPGDRRRSRTRSTCCATTRRVAKAGQGAGPHRHPARAAAGLRRPRAEGQGAPAEVGGLPAQRQLQPRRPRLRLRPRHRGEGARAAPRSTLTDRPPSRTHQDACAYHPVG